MRFHVDIDELHGGRPEGRVTEARHGGETPFSGWVELLRLLEGHCAVEGLCAVEGFSAVEGFCADDGPDGLDARTGTRRGSS